MPGFRDGFTHVNRDESRHVGFGVKFLADAIKSDERYKQVVQETLQETLPVGVLAFSPDVGRGPLRLRDPLLPLEGGVRVRDELAVEEARRDGDGAQRGRGRGVRRSGAEPSRAAVEAP